MTLHEEIVAILKKAGREMTTKEIADKVNERDNYKKRDGTPVTPFQIHGRTKNYPKLFTREGNKVGLVEKEKPFIRMFEPNYEPDEVFLSAKRPEFSLIDEIIQVLKDNVDELSTKIISDSINRRYQYEEHEDLPTSTGKVFLVAKNNPDIFEVNGDKVGLKEWNPDLHEFIEDYMVYGQSMSDEATNQKSGIKNISIKTYGIQNFKCFGNLQQIKIKPITLLFGPNSAGKSSLVQSILYLQNAFATKTLDTHYMQISGNSVDLGGFRQMIYKKDYQKSLNYYIELSTDELGDKVKDLLNDVRTIRVNFEIRQPLKQKDRRKVIRVEESTIFYDELPTDEFIPSGKPKVEKFEVSTDNELLLKISLRRNLVFRVDYLNNENKVIKRLIEALILSNTTATNISDSDWQRIQDSMDSIVNELYSKDVEFIPKSLKKAKLSLEDSEQKIITISKESRKEDLVNSLKLTLPYSLSDIIEAVYDLLQQQLENLIYLGPMRSFPPRHLLHSDNNDPNWVAGGASAWERLRDDKVVREKVNKWLESTEKLGTKYRIEVRKLVDLKSSDLENKFYEAAQDVDFQLSELSEWVGEGGVVDKIKEKLADEESIEGLNDLALIDLNSNTPVTHRDVGFGLSQVIPVLVSAYGNKGKIIMIEQPEIHLHPALQAELGDVVIESALGENKNHLILENHSEHLMLRILRRIRENNEGNAPEHLPKITPDNVQVIYAKPSKEGSILHEIPVTPDGDFAKRWPNGFFPEREEELFGNVE